MAVRVRSGQLAALFRARLQERHGERERIARDLHDTLLQGSQGLILRLHAISQSAQTPDNVRTQLESAMQLAERNLAEGRERVNALRDGPFAGRDLATALADVHAEYAGQGTNPLRLTVEGTPPVLQPDAVEEVFLIGREAIRNALRHAQASAIEVELSFGSRCFLLHVRDDGVGIADDDADHGHWGLQGMRERAQRLGAELQLWTRPGLGTEVALAVPARRLYHRRPPRWRWPWSRKSHD
jgi:signal transduction histidine kinase